MIPDPTGAAPASHPDPLRDLALAARHDIEAFDQLVRATQVDVWRMCAALVDRDAADDLTQETFLRVVRALPSFRGESSVRTWVLSIARRVTADHLRKLSRQRALDLAIRRQRLAAGSSLGSTLEIDDLIGALPVPQRTAFVLTQVLGLSYAEAAEAAGCPVGTIRSRVARARAALVELHTS